LRTITRPLFIASSENLKITTDYHYEVRNTFYHGTCAGAHQPYPNIRGSEGSRKPFQIEFERYRQYQYTGNGNPAFTDQEHGQNPPPMKEHLFFITLCIEVESGIKSLSKIKREFEQQTKYRFSDTVNLKLRDAKICKQNLLTL
jgi:hypothetical protein